MTYGQIAIAALCACPFIAAGSSKHRIAAIVWALTYQPALFALAYLFATGVVVFPVMLLNGGSVPGFASWLGMLAAGSGATIAFVHGVRWIATGLPGFPCEVPMPPLNPMK